MKIQGMRGRSSPMTSDRIPEVQKEAIRAIVAEAREEGKIGILEVRYSTYIGPGCAAERGDLTVCADGYIWKMVMPDGRSY